MTENVLDNIETQSEEEDLLTSLVGPDKKFKSTEALAKGKMESDQYIETLKGENAEMRKALDELQSKVNEGATVQSLMDQIRDLKATSGETSNQEGLSEEELTTKISSILQDQQTEQVKRANYEKANATVLSKFSNDADKAREFLKTRSSELGVGLDTLRDLGRSSPRAFAELLGLEVKASSASQPSVSSLATQNTPASQAFSDEVRDAAYYTKLRKELGSKFWDPQIQQQKMRDAKKLGDRFFKS